MSTERIAHPQPTRSPFSIEPSPTNKETNLRQQQSDIMPDGIFHESSQPNGVYRTQEAWTRRLEQCLYGFATAVIVGLAVLVFIAIPNEVRVEREQHELIPSAAPTTIIHDAQGAGTHFRDFTDFPTGSPTSRRLPTRIPTMPPTSLRTLQPIP